jgi:hypothetical protein
MRTKLQLYTVPGQVYCNSTRQLVLKGADGIVFVADSQDFALDANQESLQNLEDNLKRQGIRLREMPLVMQYNKRDLPNALPVNELNAELNKVGVPSFESVATTGLGVEETLKGITQLVLAHLVKKYGLEGAEPLEKEIQILNAPSQRAATSDSLWDEEEEDPFAAAPAPPARSSAAPAGEAEFDLDDASDENIPLVATELLPSSVGQSVNAGNPFEDVTDYFSTPGPAAASASAPAAIEVPMMSVEIPIPKGILESLPVLGEDAKPAPSQPERRVNDGLVKEVSIPLNLSVDELRQHRRLRLKITLDVNLLP